MQKLFNPRFLVCGLIAMSACAPSSQPIPGPDKQFSSGVQGAITGAGAGAVTGFQVAAGTGPGAVVGAGFGAVAGGIQGATEDAHEEAMIRLSQQTQSARARAEAQAILQKYYDKRITLHPTRDIYPADLFFVADTAHLSQRGEAIVKEMAMLNKQRLPWSRLVIATYVKATNDKSDFAQYLSKKRAVELGDAFVKNGIEPRRIETRPMILDHPIFIDPEDKPLRYSQAVELIAVDR